MVAFDDRARSRDCWTDPARERATPPGCVLPPRLWRTLCDPELPRRLIRAGSSCSPMRERPSAATPLEMSDAGASGTRRPPFRVHPTDTTFDIPPPLSQRIEAPLPLTHLLPARPDLPKRDRKPRAFRIHTDFYVRSINPEYPLRRISLSKQLSFTEHWYTPRKSYRFLYFSLFSLFYFGLNLVRENIIGCSRECREVDAETTVNDFLYSVSYKLKI